MKLVFSLWMLNLWNIEFVDANLIVDTTWKIVISSLKVQYVYIYGFFSSMDVYMHLYLHKEKCLV